MSAIDTSASSAGNAADDIPPPPEPTIEEALEEIGKTIRDRMRRYPELISRGRLNANTAAQKLIRLQKAESTLGFMRDNRDWIIAEWQRRQRMRREAENDPAAAALLEAFPDAQLVEIRNVASGRLPTEGPDGANERASP